MIEPATHFRDMTLTGFSEALASEASVPGGGSAAALAACLAAGLTGMVVRLSMGRSAYQAYAGLHQEALEAADAARERFMELVEEDALAYSAYLAASRLPRETRDQEIRRDAAKRAAAQQATTVPLAVVQDCHRLVDLAERLAGRTNVRVASDLDVAALLLDAAARGAAANAIVNLEAVGDGGFSDAVLAELDQRLRQIQSAAARTREAVRKGSLRSPEAT